MDNVTNVKHEEKCDKILSNDGGGPDEHRLGKDTCSFGNFKFANHRSRSGQ